MSDPRRLKDAESSEALRRALDSADEDGTFPGADARMLAALGLGEAPGGAGPGGSEGGGAGAAGGATGGPTAGAGGLGMTGKVAAALVLVIGGGAVSATIIARGDGQPREPTATTAPSSTSASPTVVSSAAPSGSGPTPTARAAEPPERATSLVKVASEGTPKSTTAATTARSEDREPLPSSPTSTSDSHGHGVAAPSTRAELDRVGAAPSGSGETDAASSTDTLSAELELLTAAHAAILGKDAPLAESRLASYGARFPRGTLRSEAEVLGIEALELRDPSRAGDRARAFLERNPGSPLARRVRRIASVGAP